MFYGIDRITDRQKTGDAKMRSESQIQGSEPIRMNRCFISLILSCIASLPLVSQDWPMGNSVYSTPVPANGVLYIMTRSELYAVAGSAGGSDR
jgi:hypothetical protein